MREGEYAGLIGREPRKTVNDRETEKSLEKAVVCVVHAGRGEEKSLEKL